MRIITSLKTIFLIFLLTFYSISIANAASRGFVTVKTQKGKVLPLYQDSYALVIGNGDYKKGWDPLPGAIKDVKEVEAALIKNGFNVILKTNLTKEGFNRAFGEFSYKYGRTEENRLLFRLYGSDQQYAQWKQQKQNREATHRID